jgi:hypothetical protein
MMDPISLIVIALVKGALLAGAQEMGRAAGRDAYQALKTMLVSKYEPAAPSIERLEREPESPERQAEVERTLRNLGADHDEELLRLSKELMKVIEQGTWIDDPLDEAKRAGEAQALSQTLGSHIERLRNIRGNYSLEDSELLSPNIARARDIPKRVRDDVSQLHARIRDIIEQVASNIEGGKYQETESVAKNLPGRSERERAIRLVEADKEIRISYETLRLTVEFFSELNSQVLARIQQERSEDRRIQMLFGNAITIYEMADFVIDYIESFSPGGFRELDTLHQETLRRIEKAREDQESLAASARRDGIEPKVREGILEDVRIRGDALDAFQQEWDNYVAETKQFQGRVDEVHKKIPTLELIRENARVQLNILELVSMLRFLRQSADAFKAAVETLQGFRLAPLTASKVRRLVAG